MNCPVDATALQMSDRQGIEIDYCPQCRGVWLDRGELDKIIERAAPQPASVVVPAPAGAQAPPPTRGDERGHGGDRHDDDRRHDRDRDDRGYGKKRKKESFLGELFDFG